MEMSPDPRKAAMRGAAESMVSAAIEDDRRGVSPRNSDWRAFLGYLPEGSPLRVAGDRLRTETNRRDRAGLDTLAFGPADWQF